MYCVNGKPRSSLLLESTDSMIKTNYVFCPASVLFILINFLYILIFSIRILHLTLRYLEDGVPSSGTLRARKRIQ